MSDTEKTATPPAAGGGLTLEQVTGAITAALKPLADANAALTTEVKSLRETASKAATPEAVAGMVSDHLKKHQADQAAATAASSKKADARKKAIETHLKGVPENLINLPDTDDEKALTEAAKALRTSVEKIPGVKLENVGGTDNDGGTTPATTKPGDNAAPKYTTANSGLPEGMAKYATDLDRQIAELNK